MMTIRNGVQLLAVLILLTAGSVWIAAGANRGWTKTSVPVTVRDEVTGIEGVRYEKRFVPGLDFLGAAALGGGALAGLSLCFRRQPSVSTRT